MSTFPLSCRSCCGCACHHDPGCLGDPSRGLLHTTTTQAAIPYSSGTKHVLHYRRAVRFGAMNLCSCTDLVSVRIDPPLYCRLDLERKLGWGARARGGGGGGGG